MQNKKQLRRFQFLMVIPTAAFFFYFYLFPFIKGLYYSFFKWSGYTNVKTFIGLDNFRKLFADKYISNALMNNLTLFIVTTIVTFILSLFFAVVITRGRFREAKVYRSLFFCTYVLPESAVAILWSFIFNPNIGPINSLLEAVGLEQLTRAWLGDPATALGAVMVPTIWTSVGFFMVLFVSGIQNIPQSYYEAAQIDGASELQQFFKITFPLLWEVMRTMIVFFISGSISSFAIIKIMTGQNNMATETIASYMHKQSFSFGNFGYGTAIGVLIFVISMTLSLLLRRLTKKETVEF